MAREIFRNRPEGQDFDDIFVIEGESARRLGPTEFQESFAGQTDVSDLGIRSDLFSQFFPAPPADDQPEVSGPESLPDFPETLPAPETDFTSSSAPVVSAENDLTSIIGNLGTPSESEASARAASEDFLSEIDRQIAALEERREAQLASINEQFDIAADRTREAQKRETGTTTVGLQRLGGFLGGSASQAGVLQNLANQQRLEMRQLESKRSSALAQANNAIDDKQFALAQAKAQEVKDLDKIIEDRRNKFFNQALGLLQERRLQTSAEFNIAKDIPEGEFVIINGQTFEGIKREEIEPFFTSSNLISIMQTLPEGEAFQLADPNTGQIFTLQGIRQDDPGIKTVTAIDNAGNQTVTSYRVTQGGLELINQISAGRVGKARVTGAGSGTGKLPITRSVLNKLNVAGLTDDVAISIASLLQANDEATATELLAQALAEQAASTQTSEFIGDFTPDPSFKRAEAERLISIYKENIGDAADPFGNLADATERLADLTAKALEESE